jgi:PucR family transcriptional regulator, purine catabolism regulatory protein
MRFSMKDVLEMEILKPAKVRSARHKLEQRPVEWVSVMEYPVENYIRKNEFVLSTAMGCGTDLFVFRRFVRDVIDSGAAALAIAVGRYVQTIPQEVLQLAEEENFPVIELPWNIRFSDITHSVLSKLYHWQKKIADRSEELQKELLHLFLTNGTLSQAAEVIWNKIGRPVAIVNKDGTLKGQSKNAKSLIAKWMHYIRAVSGNNLWNPSSYLGKNIGTIFANGPIIQVKIHTSDINGYLLFEPPPETVLEFYPASEEKRLLEVAVTSIALWFLREDAIRETEIRLKDDFVWKLAQGEYDYWEDIQSRAKLLGYNLHLPYVCIIGSPENLNDLYQYTAANPITIEQWRIQAIRSIEEQIVLVGKAIRRSVMTTCQEEQFIIFLEVPLDQVKETFLLFLDFVENRLEKLLPGLIMSWGIGENHAEVKTFSKSFEDAKIALAIGRQRMGPGQRNTYANTGIYRIILALAGNHDVLDVIQYTIGDLVDYDKMRKSDLIATLTAYIRNQGNVSKTARDLSLHRHTLLYRLRKIESITGRSLLNPDDLFLFDLCLKIWLIHKGA